MHTPAKNIIVQFIRTLWQQYKLAVEQELKKKKKSNKPKVDCQSAELGI